MLVKHFQYLIGIVCSATVPEHWQKIPPTPQYLLSIPFLDRIRKLYPKLSIWMAYSCAKSFEVLLSLRLYEKSMNLSTISAEIFSKISFRSLSSFIQSFEGSKFASFSSWNAAMIWPEITARKKSSHALKSLVGSLSTFVRPRIFLNW